MPTAYLVKDQESNLMEQASQTQETYREYEFVFPLKNEDPGDTY